MTLILLLALLFPSPRAGADTLAVSFELPASTTDLPDAGGLRDGVLRLFTAEYGRFTTLTLAGPADGGAAAASASDATARVQVTEDAATVSITTTLTRGARARTLTSTVPSGSPQSLCATVTADLAWLHFAATGFTAFSPGPGPGLTGMIPTDAVADLLGARGDDREPLGISDAGTGMIVTFPHAYLTLGPLFRLTAESARDLFFQAAGREPLQLSGAVQGTGDTLFLLSADAGQIARVNPRVGTRDLVSVPGLSAAKLRMIDPETLADVSGPAGAARLSVYRTGAAPWHQDLPGLFASAFGVDDEGNLWIWDLGERRIRVLTRGGREVFALRPLFDPGAMPIPQQLEVLDDGSFLLAGSGEIWKFENTGIPAWRLTRIPGHPGEQLPASFQVAVNRAAGTFVILDEPSRRLLSFGVDATDPVTATLADAYRLLDPRRADQLQEALQVARTAGLTLLAQSLAGQLAQAGGTAAVVSAARADLLRERSRLSFQLADSLMRDLLYARADAAYTSAGEAARAVLATAPEDADASTGIASAASRRQEVRSALAAAQRTQVTGATVSLTETAPCARGITIRITIRNNSATPLTGVRVRANLPVTGLGPVLASAGSLDPGAVSEVTLSQDAAQAAALQPEAPTPLAVVVSAQAGAQSIAEASLQQAAVTADAGSRPLATELACDAEPGDALLRSLPATLLGPAGDAMDAGAKLAAVVDALSAERARPDGAAHDAGARLTVRALPAAAPPWIRMVASLAGSLGLKSGFASWGDTAVAVVQTAVPLATAVASAPFLQPFADALVSISPDGMLSLPYEGGAAARSWAAGVAAGLLAVARSGGAPDAVAWLDAAAPGPVLRPVPFPAALPASAPPVPAAPDASPLLRGVGEALSGAP